MNGTWNRTNKLAFQVQFYWAKDGAAISGDQYPDTKSEATLEMTRGRATEFQTLCTTLAAAK
jgi:hypothetical protein